MAQPMKKDENDIDYPYTPSSTENLLPVIGDVYRSKTHKEQTCQVVHIAMAIPSGQALVTYRIIDNVPSLDRYLFIEQFLKEYELVDKDSKSKDEDDTVRIYGPSPLRAFLSTEEAHQWMINELRARANSEQPMGTQCVSAELEAINPAMSLRNYFVGQAIAGLSSLKGVIEASQVGEEEEYCKLVASAAIAIADMTLSEIDKTNQTWQK